jgi:hypothetical protein
MSDRKLEKDAEGRGGGEGGRRESGEACARARSLIRQPLNPLTEIIG